MADVITRFKLETTQYDSKLRDASKSLAEYTRQATLAGNEFGKFTQKNTETARALGTITPSANNAKDKVKELVGAFNDVAKAYNALTKEQQQSDFGKAMAESLSQLSQQLREAKQELYDMGDAVKTAGAGGGGLFSGLGDKMSGALQVFAGNMLTKAAGAVANLGSEMVGMVQQGVEMAKAGEGIRIAFERLGRGDILDGLREATHGTVTDLELMKAAVKFNDFKLPLDELGTMLAFAQQKAKDTGQSVDYMVDSIVTGLGRKSLMILDNLGLSANEVKEKMKETGDMTKAVGEIIREQMAKAGDYVETAADRAAQANVSLQNKMEELGRKFAPLQEASNNFWTSIKIGILDVIGGPLTTLLNKLTEAGRLANQYGLLGGKAKVGRMTSNLSNAREDRRQGVYQQQVAEMNRYINRRENYMKDRQRWVNNQGNEDLRQHLLSEQKAFGTNNVGDIQNQINAAKQMLAEYQQSAKQILQPITQEIVPTVVDTTGGGGGKGGGGRKNEGPTMEGFQKDMAKWQNADLLKPEIKDNFVSVWAQMDDEGKKHMLNLNEAAEDLGDSLAKLGEKEVTGNIAKQMKKTTDAAKAQQMAMNLAAQAVSSFGSAMAGLDDPSAKAAGTVLQAIASIALGFAVASSQSNTAGTGWGWLAWVAAGMAAMATTISTIHSLTGYAEGGMIKGNSYSGDRIGGLVDGSQFVGLNAGEIVLNASQQNTLAQNLEGAGLQNLRLEGVVTGENIKIALNRHFRRIGEGEIVTW